MGVYDVHIRLFRKFAFFLKIKFQLIGMSKNRYYLLGAKNNDSFAKKQAIVKFYTMEYRKCGNSEK